MTAPASEGAMVALYPSAATAEALAAQPGATAPPEDLHLTLVFLAAAAVELEDRRPAISDAVRRVAAAAAPLRGVVGGLGLFAGDASDDERPLVALADVPGLNELRADLVRALGTDAPAEGHGFTPHLTLARVPKAEPVEAVPPPELPLEFDEVALVLAGERETFPLGVDDAEADAPVGANWIAQQGGLPPYIARIAKHLETERGMEKSRAIATAVNTAKRMAANPDGSFWPGKQDVNLGSRAEAAAAVAQWEAMKAAAAARRRVLTEARSAMQPDLEQRTVDVDVDDLSLRGNTIHGFAATYGPLSEDLGGFRERIAPGAFRDVLAADADVRALLNHDPSALLGRTRSGTLRLRDEERGLRFELDLPDSPLGANVREAVKRRDLDGASFRFKCAEDAWDGETRTIRRVAELHDVSLATTPAYPSASVELRTRPEMTTSTTTEATEREQEMENEEHTTTGRLTVENRSAAADAPTIEARIVEAMQGVAKGEARSLTTAELTGGGAITPPELSQHVFDRLAARSVALASGIRVITTDRHTVQWPQVVSDPVPAWYDELDLIVASDPVFATLEVEAKKLACRVEFSNEVLDDSVPDAEKLVRKLLMRALAEKLDLGIYYGNPATDADSIRGLRWTSGIQTLAHGGANGASIANLDVFAQAIAMLEAVNTTAGAIVMPARTWAGIRTLKDADERPLLGDFSAETRPSIYGVPVYFTTGFPVNETAGTSSDASSIFVYSTDSDVGPVLVRRQDVEILLDRSRLFDVDGAELRAKTRVALLVPQPSAVVRVTGVRP